MKKVVLIASMLTVCNLFGISGEQREQFTYIREGVTYTKMNEKQQQSLREEILDEEEVTRNVSFAGPHTEYLVYTYNKGTRSVKVEKLGSIFLKFVYYNNTDKKAFYSSNSVLFKPMVGALDLKIEQNRKRNKKQK